MIITVTPNPSLDLTYMVDRLQRGAVHRSRQATAEAAGKGVNISKALHQNDIATVAVVPVGGCNGNEISRLLSAAGVNSLPVAIDGRTRSNVSVVEPGGLVTKVNEVGPSIRPDEVMALLAACESVSTPGSWFVGTGSLAPGMPTDFYAQLGRRMKALDVKVAIDSSGLALRESLSAAPDLVKPNRHELEELVGRQFTVLGDVVAAAGEAIQLGAGSVLVSLGSDGVVLVDDRSAHHGSATVEVVRNTVGAGDALLAGYLAAGGGGPAALRQALAWARASVQSVRTAMEPSFVDSYDAIVVGPVDVDRRLTDEEPAVSESDADHSVGSGQERDVER